MLFNIPSSYFWQHFLCHPFQLAGVVPFPLFLSFEFPKLSMKTWMFHSVFCRFLWIMCIIFDIKSIYKLPHKQLRHWTIEMKYIPSLFFRMNTSENISTWRRAQREHWLMKIFNLFDNIFRCRGFASSLWSSS